MTTFIDTSILIHITNTKANEHKDSLELLEKCKLDGPVILSDIVYSEFSSVFKSIEDTDRVLAEFSFERAPLNKASLFRAGKAFREYKEKNKGPKLNVLSDFLIGAQVETSEAALLTNNKKDFVNYFPKLTIHSLN